MPLAHGPSGTARVARLTQPGAGQEEANGGLHTGQEALSVRRRAVGRLRLRVVLERIHANRRRPGAGFFVPEARMVETARQVVCPRICFRSGFVYTGVSSRIDAYRYGLAKVSLGQKGDRDSNRSQVT